jgi:hypothetical protein
VTAATGTGRDTGRHKGREASARQAHQRAQHLGEEIRSRRGAHEADERIAQRLKIAIANLDRYAALPEADDVEPEPDGSGYDTRWAAGEGDRRAARAVSLAAALVRCLAAEDAEGVRRVLCKVRDWYAFAVVLAAARDGELP